MDVRQLDSTDIQARAAKICRLLLDNDGVMTDSKLYLTPDGQEMKAVDVMRGGWGVKALLAARGLC